MISWPLSERLANSFSSIARWAVFPLLQLPFKNGREFIPAPIFALGVISLSPFPPQAKVDLARSSRPRSSFPLSPTSQTLCPHDWRPPCRVLRDLFSSNDWYCISFVFPVVLNIRFFGLSITSLPSSPPSRPQSTWYSSPPWYALIQEIFLDHPFPSARFLSSL